MWDMFPDIWLAFVKLWRSGDKKTDYKTDDEMQQARQMWDIKHMHVKDKWTVPEFNPFTKWEAECMNKLSYDS